MKAAQEKAAIESDSDKEAEMRAERDKMKAGAVRVGKQIYIPTDAVRIKGGGVSALFVDGDGEGDLVHSPTRRRKPLVLLGGTCRSSSTKVLRSLVVTICASSSLPAGYWAKEQKYPLRRKKSAVECCVGDWMKVVGVSQKTPVTVDAVENPPTNIRFDNFCIQLMI